MQEKLYELLWQVETDTASFPYREFKVFHLPEEAAKYGKRHEIELNDGVSVEEKAQDGYYFKYCCSNEVMEIDGFAVSLARHNH